MLENLKTHVKQLDETLDGLREEGKRRATIEI